MVVNSSENSPYDQPALEADGMPELPPQRFDPDQRRAFGSVPRLLGATLDIPDFNRLNGLAVERVTPTGLRRGLLGVEGGNAVDTIVLSPEEYTAIVRSPASFQSAIQAKTLSAARSNNPIRAQEKELKSGRDAFREKWNRQNLVIKGLTAEQATLKTLLTWQKDPGFNRAKEVDIVNLAGQAWSGTMYTMLRTCKDQYGLSPEELTDMSQALAYRLFRGPQTDRIKNWGETLQVAQTYTGAKLKLFENRQRKVTQFGHRLSDDLEDFYTKHGIFELT